MWVCVCKAVRDREVKAAIEGGAATREAVTEACGAGGDCGACHHMIEEMIEAGEEQLVLPTALVRPSRAPSRERAA